MSQKSEIKVYLPLKLIGELEGKKRAGMRSKFIEKAINEKLKNTQGSYMDDFPTLPLLCHLRERLEEDYGGPNITSSLLQLIIDEVLE